MTISEDSRPKRMKEIYGSVTIGRIYLTAMWINVPILIEIQI